MPQQLSQDKIRRMITGGSGGSGGGGSFDPSSMAGMASQAWVEQNYLSKAFFSQLFKAFKPGASTSDPDEEVMPNTIDEHITSIKAMFGLWTEQYLSALGQNSGGGGGGVTLNEPLESINGSGMSAPGATEDGKTIVWDNTQQKWKYGAAGGGGGSTAWSDITGKPTTIGGYGITDAKIQNGTIYLGSNNITPLVASDITDMATKTWVTNQGYAVASNVYTKTEADAKYMTIAAFENLFNAINSGGNKVSHPYSSGVASIKALVGLWTEQYLSALGQSSGGGGGVTLNEPLASINSAGLGMPTASGQVPTWNGSQWIYSIPGGGGTGTVTSITAGTGLSGGTITTMGTIAISSTYQTYISHGETAYGWGDHSTEGYLKSVAFSDLTSHPTTIAGYGITDAYISSGTIYLGNNSITPLTSFTETDPTVPAWAKASTKPSYSFSEITGTIASSQLPTLYWANVQVSSSSSDTTEPKMKSLHLYGSGQFGVGGLLKFGDGSDDGYVYLKEASDDKLTIYGKSGIYMMGGTSFKVGIGTTSPAKVLDVAGDINATLDITTAQAVNARNIELSFTSPFIDFHHASSSADYTSRLITTDYGTLNLQSKTSSGTDKLSGFVVGANYDGSFIQIGNIKIVYDSSNNALKIIKSDGTAANLYATGGIAALGTT